VRDIPTRAAVVVVALVLLASIVMGREEPSPAVIEPVAPGAPQGSTRSGYAAAPDADLDLALLKRAPSKGQVGELFAGRTWAAAPAPPPKPAVVALAAPPRPVAPPLPFTFLGRMVEDGKAVVFLGRGKDGLAAKVGDTVAGKYRLESLSDTAVTFVYLPLGTKQTLPISATQ